MGLPFGVVVNSLSSCPRPKRLYNCPISISEAVLMNPVQKLTGKEQREAEYYRHAQ